MRLLVAEDDPMLGPGLKRALERAGYAVDLATTGDEAIAAARAEAYSLTILDLGLPGVNGLEVLKDIRRRRDSMPVIILTARDRASQKVEGLDAGADDYMVKPFDLEELLARVRAQVRRREQRTSDSISAHGVTIDLAARTVMSRGEPASVTAKEFKVLAALMRRRGRFVSKSELESAVYDAAAEVESNTIETAVYGLRRKLGADLILTARGLGYMVPQSE